MHSVLTELLRLYDWRREVGATITNDQAREYGHEKKAAWEAARRVLASSETRTMSAPSALETEHSPLPASPTADKRANLDAKPTSALSNAELARDAARYRWLREHWEDFSGLTWRKPPLMLDAAITKAMCAQKGHVWVGIGDDGKVVCDECGQEKL